jgi:hypothetical protein
MSRAVRARSPDNVVVNLPPLEDKQAIRSRCHAGWTDDDQSGVTQITLLV